MIDWDKLVEQANEDMANWKPPVMQKPQNNRTGACRECGIAISRKRLAAIPYANNCRECQMELEKEKAE